MMSSGKALLVQREPFGKADDISSAAKTAAKADNYADAGKVAAKTTKKTKTIKYPGADIDKPPEEGFEWRGRSSPKEGKGNWFNPKTREKWNADLEHGDPIGPHWDYTDPEGKTYRVYPDGHIEKK